MVRSVARRFRGMIRFTIITVSKNAAATIERAIASVRTQRYRHFEYILVDGASIDETMAIAARHRDVITTIVSEPDQGIYDAMNKGLALAHGDFIYFLGGDDYLLDDHVLGDVATFIEAQPDCDFVYGGIRARLSDGRAQDFMPPAADDALKFMICGCLPHQASFASRRTFDVTGGFDARYRIAGDYDWFLRVLTQPTLVTRRIERIIASYHMDGVSNRLAESQREVYSIQNALPIYRRPAWLRHRLIVFQKEIVAQRRRAEALARAAQKGRVQEAARVLYSLGVYAATKVLGPLAKLEVVERDLRAAQEELLTQRINNDARARTLGTLSPS